MADRGDNWLDETAALYKSALESLPKMTRQNRVAELYRQLAGQALEQKNQNLQFSALLNISELNCSVAADHLIMANILSSNGADGEALAHYYEAVKLSDDPEYRNEFGFCLLRTNKARQATSQFRKVLGYDEANPLAKLGLGISLWRTNQREQGMEMIREAIRLDSSIRNRLETFSIPMD